MKKKLVLMTSALMAVGLIATLVNNQGNTVRVEAIEPIDVTIAKRYNESYSYGGCYTVGIGDKTGDMIFWFMVDHDTEIEQSHRLTPNKTYTLANMSTSSSYAKISGERFEYTAASLKKYSDENGYIGYEAEATLNNGMSYSIHEAKPMSGKMIIDGYKDEYGMITLEDEETGSKFYFVISNIKDGVTYNLSDLTECKYCNIGDRYWGYREATFKRTTDDAGLIHVVATVITEHGDSLSLKYNPVAATGVALNKTSTTLKFGGSETLVATVSPDDADNKSVTWSSSDESVATVDETGKVTTVSVGSAVITVTTKDGEFKATCAVTVTESAVSVTNRINALPTPENVTLDDKDAIEAARKVYDSLDADEKALVTTETLKKLTDDEAAYQNLVDTAAANAIIEMIDLLPEPAAVTINDKNAIQQARAAYNALTDAQKAKVPADKLQKLVDDEAAYADLEAANNAVNIINALPEPAAVTINDKNAIQQARVVYDALTTDQKAKVPAEVLKKLTDDEAALAKEEADTAAANAVIEKINALPQPNAVTINDGEAIEAARAAYNALTADQKVKVSAEILKKLTDDETAYAKVVADTEAANKVIELINALPNASDVTKNDKEAIEAARAAYEALTEDQKAKISNDVLQLLVNDENALKSIPTGLPAGAIVGIVIGSVVVAGLGGFALVWFVIKKKTWADFVAIFKKKK